MDESTVKSKLLELDWKHAAYLHHRCQVDPPTVKRLNEIMKNQYGRRAGFSSAYQWNMGNDISELLELEAMPQYGDLPCEVLHQLTGGSAPSPQSWARIQEENQDSITGAGIPGEQLAQSLFSTVWLTQLRRRVSGFFAGTNFSRRQVLGVLALLAIVVIVFALRNTIFDGDDEATPEDPVAGADVPAVITQEVIVTSETNFEATNEALQASILALEQTLEAQPTVAPEVIIVEITATPLPDTPGPSPTPFPPTNTPPPPATPTPVVVEPFEDNFDAGPNDAWEVIDGTPIWANGTLATNGNSQLAIGDPNWTDYRVEIIEPYVRGFTEVTGIGVRGLNANHLLEFELREDGGSRYGQWAVYDQGSRSVVPLTRINGIGNASEIVIEVKGNSITAQLPSGEESQFFNQDFKKGKIFIRLSGRSTIGGIKISPIEE